MQKRLRFSLTILAVVAVAASAAIPRFGLIEAIKKFKSESQLLNVEECYQNVSSDYVNMRFDARKLCKDLTDAFFACYWNSACMEAGENSTLAQRTKTVIAAYLSKIAPDILPAESVSCAQSKAEADLKLVQEIIDKYLSGRGGTSGATERITEPNDTVETEPPGPSSTTEATATAKSNTTGNLADPAAANSTQLEVASTEAATTEAPTTEAVVTGEVEAN